MNCEGHPRRQRAAPPCLPFAEDPSLNTAPTTRRSQESHRIHLLKRVNSALKRWCQVGISDKATRLRRCVPPGAGDHSVVSAQSRAILVISGALPETTGYAPTIFGISRDNPGSGDCTFVRYGNFCLRRASGQERKHISAIRGFASHPCSAVEPPSDSPGIVCKGAGGAAKR
jgi:hypothetical protein